MTGGSELRLARTVDAIAAAGPFALVIWDFDGVIADTEPVQAWAYRQILFEYGVSPDDDFFESYIGQTESAIWAQLRVRFGLPEEVGVLRTRRMDVFLREAMAKLVPNPFVEPLAAILATAGADQRVISSGNREVILPLLRHWRLDGLFSEVVASDDANVDDYSKADEMEKAITSAAGPVVVIEDHVRYLELAAAFGAVTVGVRHRLNRLGAVVCDFYLDI